MQTLPNWTKQYSPKIFEQELEIKFNGPGLYMTKTNTILVTPLPPNEPATPENIWTRLQPSGMLYEVQCYNSPLEQTIFAVIALVPNRLDTR